MSQEGLILSASSRFRRASLAATALPGAGPHLSHIANLADLAEHGLGPGFAVVMIVYHELPCLRIYPQYL
jgi:hypothetical protein